MTKQVEVEETEAATAAQRNEDHIADLFTKMNERANERGLSTLRDAVEGVLARPSDQQSAVAEVIEDQTERAEAMRVPAREGARVQLSSLSDARYKALPADRQFRSADSDYAIQRWLTALKTKDGTVLREIAAKEQNSRAVLAIGDSTAGAPFDGAGGQLVPLPLSDYLLNVFYRTARMRAMARTFQAGASASLRIPIQSLSSVTAWIAEGITYGDGTGAPNAASSVQLQLQKLTNISDITDEMLASSPFNVGAWVTDDVGMNMAAEEDLAMFSTGAGAASNEPIGLEAADITITGATPNPTWYVQGPDQSLDNIAPTDIDVGHLSKMFWTLPEKERRAATWWAGDTVAQHLANLVDSNGRQVLNFHDNPRAVVGDADSPGSITTILGRPFVNLPGKSDPGATPAQDENRLYFGNMPRTYAILEQGGITAKATEDFKFNLDVTTFKFTRRVDGQPIGNKVAAVPKQYVYTGGIKGVV